MTLGGLKIKPDMFSVRPTFKAIDFAAVTTSPCPHLSCSLHRVVPGPVGIHPLTQNLEELGAELGIIK